MSDFGRILDEWESERKKQKKAPKKKAPPAVSATPLDRWLDKYDIPDKDSLQRQNRTRGLSRRELLAMDPQDTLDLHGFTVEEALIRLDKFLRAASKKNMRKVLIIHGKGYHSPGNKPVLKLEVRKFLERNTLIGEFGPAHRRQGGDGAVWAILRVKV